MLGFSFRVILSEAKNLIFLVVNEENEESVGKIKVWFDPEGDYLEVMFEQKEGYFRETAIDQVTEKVNMEGNVIGFSIMKLSSLKEHPLDIVLSKVEKRERGT